MKDFFKIADEIIYEVYPNWNHIQNHGILRGAIANGIKKACKQSVEAYVIKIKYCRQCNSIPCKCDNSMKFVQHRPRNIHSLFGWIKIKLAYYHCPDCGTGLAPYDKRSGGYLGTGDIWGHLT